MGPVGVLGKRLAGWGAIGAVAVGGGALVLHFVGTPWQLVVALTAVAHYAMWAAPAGLALALALRHWRTTAAAAVVTAFVLVVQVPANVDAGASGARRLVVLQANLKVGGADPDALVRLVRRTHSDLLATEELTTAEQTRLLAAGLADVLPHRFTEPLPDGGGGLGIWSRYPLDAARDVPGFWLGVVTANVRLPGGDVTFVGVHLTPPYPYPSGKWRREIARLRGVLPRTGRVIAAGDFNATTDHAQFRDLLEHGYGDAAERAGSGYLPTYPNDRWYGPVVGIDHVLVRGGLGVVSADTLELRGSDHRALVVRARY